MTKQRSNEKILVAGASVRSAAQSIVRAGFEPLCADLFGDSDLRQIADVHVINDYPEDFADWANQIYRENGRLPFMYTGGLENFPKTIDSIAEQHDLRGTAGDSLQSVRDPSLLSDCFFKANIPYPLVRIGANAELLAHPNENWLKKPIHGSAGFGISRWKGDTLSPTHYLQQQITGPSVSVLYVASGGTAQLIGATLQLVGCKSLAGGRYGWCGSFGPLPLNALFESQATSIGNAVASQFHLKGIFGVDCVITGQSLLPIEVNPRYTGSVEVLEKAIGWPAITHHLQACQPEQNSGENKAQNPLFAPKQQQAKIGYCGKAILFAPQSILINNLSNADKTIADIPMDGTVIEQGHPICTIMGDATEPIDCIDHWSENVRRVCDQLPGQDLGFDREIQSLWQELCHTDLID